MKMTGAQILCEGLVKEGVDVIFGIPGGSTLPLYDTLPQYPQLRHALVRHEQAAAHAADGYARATGKVGVCLATSGPGATNLVTGIATAFLDSSLVPRFSTRYTINEFTPIPSQEKEGRFSRETVIRISCSLIL